MLTGQINKNERNRCGGNYRISAQDGFLMLLLTGIVYNVLARANASSWNGRGFMRDYHTRCGKKNSLLPAICMGSPGFLCGSEFLRPAID